MNWEQVWQQLVTVLAGGSIALLPYVLQFRRQDADRRREEIVRVHRERIEALWAVIEALAEAEELDLQAASTVNPIESGNKRINELQADREAIVPHALSAGAESFTRETYSRILDALTAAVSQRDALITRQQDLGLRRRAALLRARAASIRYGRIPAGLVGDLPSEMLSTYALGLVEGLLPVNRLQNESAWTAVIRFETQITILADYETRAIGETLGVKPMERGSTPDVSRLREFCPSSHESLSS